MFSVEERRQACREEAEVWRKLHDHQIKAILWERRVFKDSKFPECGSCRRVFHCRRIIVNRSIRRSFLRGEECPDLDSIWDLVF